MAHIPDFFFIRAQVRNDRFPDEARYCLVSVTPIHNAANGILWKTKLVEGSKHLVSSATLRHDGIEMPPVNVWHERDTSLHASGVFYYECKMWRTQNYLQIPGQGNIWEYKMTHANRTLPSNYNHVGNCKDTCKKWHFTLSDLPRPVPIVPTGIPVAVNKIPSHVLHAFIEMAISKREECPISMEPITKENAGYLPCGHLFNKDSLRTAVAISKTCPTCRASAGADDIQVW